VVDVYVRADGAALAALATALDEGVLSVRVAATLPLTDAAAALDGAVSGRAGAVVLVP
jgi:NADPH:quinone reductase-like Zn-dependent oxidoreductase